MDQPPSRKRAADATTAAEPEEEKIVSPSTTLEIDLESPNGRRKYQGSFKYKVPSMGDRIDIAVLKAQYLQQIEGVEAGGTNIAEMLSHLSITIDAKSAPAWWTESNGGIELYDYTPIVALYAKARAYEATFLGADNNDEDDSGAPEGKLGNDDSGPVDGDVQPPGQRSEVLATFGKGSGRAGDDGPGGAPVAGGAGGGGSEESSTPDAAPG